MKNIAYINPRAERHAKDLRGTDLYFYHVANSRHDRVKLERAQDRADRLRRANAMASRIFTAMLFVGALLLLAL